MNEKQNEKNRKKFLKIVGAKKKDTYEQINKKIIGYVHDNTSHWITNSLFSHEQLSDPKFLINLYNSSFFIIDLVRPSIDLIKNHEFMIEYIKLYAKRHNILDTQEVKSRHIKAILNQYASLLYDEKFIEKLCISFPNIDSLTLVFETIYNNSNLSHIQLNEQINNLARNISRKSYLQHASFHGTSFLEYVPKDYPYYTQIIEMGIKKDGFKALEYLNINEVVQNKRLIIQAYLCAGFEELDYYIKRTLSPLRTASAKIDKKYAEVQILLLNDPDIKYIYKIHRIKQNNDEKLKSQLLKNNIEIESIEKE